MPPAIRPSSAKGFGQKHPPSQRRESPHFTIQIHSLYNQYLYSAIDNSMFVFAKTCDTFDEYEAAQFLTDLMPLAPVGVQSVATSGHPVFSDTPEAPWSPSIPGATGIHFFLCRENRVTHHREGPRSATPGLVVNGWGQILRRPIANRRFTPLSLADRKNLKRLAEEGKDNWRDGEWDVFEDRQLSAEEAADRRQARLAARMEAKAAAMAEAETYKRKRWRRERTKRRRAGIAAGLQRWTPEERKNQSKR